MRPWQRSDAELLALTAEDPNAFGVFYRRHMTAVLAYLMRRIHRADVAADACAETFARALEQKERFDPGRGPARAWLFVIAGSVLTDSLRHGQVEARARARLGMPARELTDDDLERVERLVDARRGPSASALVADLPAEQREAVLARVVQERSYADIAAELTVSEAVIRQRVSRGLAGLRARLGGQRG